MSSVILLVIVAAWAIVLVPMLLNRHDAGSEARSVDRFATAMRVLARRSAAPPGQRYVVVPPRPDVSVTVVVNGATRWERQAAEARRRVAQADEDRKSAGRTDAGPSAASHIRRRRRNLLILAVVNVVTIPAGIVITPTVWILEALAAPLLIGYVVHLRRAAARIERRRRRRAARTERVLQEHAAPKVLGQTAPRAAEPAPPINAVVIERQRDGSWLPVPVPRPTYVDAPPAPEHSAAARHSAPDPVVPTVTEEELDRHLDELERRLAVNE